LVLSVNLGLLLPVLEIGPLYTEATFFPYPPPIPTKISSVPLEWISDIGSADCREHRLTNREISFEVFQHMWSRCLTIEWYWSSLSLASFNKWKMPNQSV